MSRPKTVRIPVAIDCTESDSPRLCFFRILVGVEVQLSRVPAHSETAPAGMYRGATPIKPKGHMWSCPGRAARPVSVLGFAPGDRDPGFKRAPMLTGAPNKVRGRSA